MNRLKDMVVKHYTNQVRLSIQPHVYSFSMFIILSTDTVSDLLTDIWFGHVGQSCLPSKGRGWWCN